MYDKRLLCKRGEQYYDIIHSALDLFCAHKYIPGSGITLNWFMDTFLKGMDKSEAFAYMEASVPRLAPGCEGLTAVGLLGGSAMPFKGELKAAGAGSAGATGRSIFIGHCWKVMHMIWQSHWTVSVRLIRSVSKAW